MATPAMWRRLPEQLMVRDNAPVDVATETPVEWEIHSQVAVVRLDWLPVHGAIHRRVIATLRLGLLCVFLFLAVSVRVAAHSAPYSFIDLILRGEVIEGSLVVHIYDASHDLNIVPPESLLEPDFLERQRPALTALLSPRLHIRAEDREVLPEWTTIEPLPEQHAVRLRFRITAASPRTLTVAAALFPYDSVHQTYLNIYEDNVIRRQFVITAKSGEKTYYAGSTQDTASVIKTFVPSGISHILIGPDHILFLAGLLLLGGTWRTLVTIVSAFTLGHSITLSLAALTIVSPPAWLVEPAIALSIVVVGADNLIRRGGRDLRAWMALGFGLVHGFGFANVLREVGLPRQALGWSLFSFNVGVEIGQLGIVLVLASAFVMMRRWNAEIGQRVTYAGSVVVIAAGAFWFVERVFFPA